MRDRNQSDIPTLLLVNPWITDFAAYDFWLKPLGLLYLAAVLRRADYAVRLVDCMDRSHPELLQWQGLEQPINRRWSTGKFLRTPIPKPALYRHVPRVYARYGMPPEIFEKLCLSGPKPEAILVTSGMTYWYPGVQMAIATLRRWFADTPILLGGIYATLCTDHARQFSGADLVIPGEAESAIVARLREVLSNDENITDENHLSSNGFPTLDDLPFPAFDLYPKLQFATIMTSRGCPLKCTFCASRLVSGQYRSRSIDNVIAELDWLHSGLGVNEFAFYDDALLTNRDRHFLPLCEKIIEHRIRATFHTPNGLQAKYIDANTARLMWQTGFKTIRLAYESGSAMRQRDMSKKVSNESFARAVAKLYAAGYGPRELDAYVMIALPDQPIQEVLWSMAFVHSLGVGIRLATFSPIPGTIDYDRTVARGELPRDADPLLTNNSILPVRLPEVSDETYERINRLAKTLNAHLRQTGRPLDSSGDLYKRLSSQLTLEAV
ncbi:MAG: B12-binding domain-containing radical SAM protein [candidate division KSB1 bacterium]|nr:B12-binding domain-containing radical SAM protein [candidate division KSB1 bacterium]MDZ7301327.1 B12-binding domain-containing radical SAM protein [candidate division KSB1 bacterium]MDZ7310788.1 B12-binding domain-containing radical SAM protein [candidate division KSB1 bacterium]